MIRKLRPVYFALLSVLVLAAPGVFGAAEESEQELVVTHADAAVLFAKYSGMFERYVPKEAELGECVSFLNGAGIYFGLLEIATGATFTVEDCARVMGQAELVFAGEALFVAGKVQLPSEVSSWEEYCDINDIKYLRGHESMKQLLQVAKQKNR